MNLYDIIRDPSQWISTTVCNGVWSGIVEDNNDPERCGRIKVRVHQVHGDVPTNNLPWTHTISQSAGRPTSDPADNAGHFNIPEIGTHCWVTFILGNYRFPIYVGQSFGNPNGQNDTPSVFLTNYPDRRGYVDPSGVKTVYDDRDKIWFIEDPSGQRVKLVFDGETKELLLETDETRIRIAAGGDLVISAFDDSTADFAHKLTVTTGDTLEVTSNEQIKVHARDKIFVEAEGEVSVLSKRDNVEIESLNGDVVVKARNIKLQGRDTVKITSRSIEVEADINLKLNGKRVDIG